MLLQPLFIIIIVLLLLKNFERTTVAFVYTGWQLKNFFLFRQGKALRQVPDELREKIGAQKGGGDFHFTTDWKRYLKTVFVGYKC